MNTAGTTAFNNVVGGGAKLVSITTDLPGGTTINTTGVNTTQTQTYLDPVTLGSNTTLSSIGAGAAGSSALTNLQGRGYKMALVERDKLGGTCLNYGCDPTKTLLYIASQLHKAQHANRYGLQIPHAGFDWSAVQKYVQAQLAPQAERAATKHNGWVWQGTGRPFFVRFDNAA